MKKINLTDFERDAKKATPGPWFFDIGNGEVESHNDEHYRVGVVDRSLTVKEYVKASNYSFIGTSLVYFYKQNEDGTRQEVLVVNMDTLVSFKIKQNEV